MTRKRINRIHPMPQVTTADAGDRDYPNQSNQPLPAGEILASDKVVPCDRGRQVIEVTPDWGVAECETKDN